MSTRYDDRDYDQEDDRSSSRSEYGRSYRGRSEGRYRHDDSDRQSGRYRGEGEYRRGYSGGMSGRSLGYDDEYTGRSSYGGGRESRMRDDYSGRSSHSRDRESGLGDEYTSRTSSSRRDPYRSEGYGYDRWENEGGSGSPQDRAYGGFGRYSDEEGHGLSSSEYSQRYNYPQSRRSESYRDRSGREYQGGQYWRGQQRGYEGERGRSYGSGEDRGWWDRTSDEIASWFGDREAERRRQMDRQREFRGRGPKGYRRSDERIKEDVNDRLSEGYLDASEIEVLVVNAEVTLTGTVNRREEKRLAEDIAESVSGVSNVENRLRVTQSSLDRPLLGTTGASATGTGQTTGTAGSTSGTQNTGTTGTSQSSATTGTTGRGRGAGS